MINMTKHTDYGSPSIMEPVDETPSLTLTVSLLYYNFMCEGYCVFSS